MKTPNFPARPEVPGKTESWRRDSLRLGIISARSIEDTGLDSSLYGSFLSPQAAVPRSEEIWSKDSNCDCRTGNLMGEDVQRAKKSDQCCDCQHIYTQEIKQDPENFSGKLKKQESRPKESFLGNGQVNFENGEVKLDPKKIKKGYGQGGKVEMLVRKGDVHVQEIVKEEETETWNAKSEAGIMARDHSHPGRYKPSSTAHNLTEVGSEHANKANAIFPATFHVLNGREGEYQETKSHDNLDGIAFIDVRNAFSVIRNNDAAFVLSRPQAADFQCAESSAQDNFTANEEPMTPVFLENVVKEDGLPPPAQSLDASLSESSTTVNHVDSPRSVVNSTEPLNSLFAESPTGVRDVRKTTFKQNTHMYKSERETQLWEQPPSNGTTAQ